ncbi:hypothetical protein PTSG_06673 [Salpingoeca rosetta]|uniref:Sister chromatid cohesion protein DCC1 n=1 Tax=Salpingoeca rosetta (strain ATCC 50818 / BSB-021) TaxID=946362 RepID=F2UFN8_SALR5|nr:uncharacterized protein PTSG_06673 [Salpingoeca rosetta]EGD75606.1 hypothetical protein PTSG_06673 [Salpingoeca rosetta]|eukprot:XP_004992063.1 hypothetical protein PTSG_06673 [Salpingoeca rosetta]
MAGKLEFAGDFESSDLVLMQVDSHVLDAIEQGNQQVSFKACGNDSVVLCTDTRTYSVKHADVSNAHYVVPPDPEHASDVLAFPPGRPRQVRGNIASYFELRHVDPSVAKVQELLRECEYNGPEEEAARNTQTLYTLDALLDVVRASREELLTALHDMHAFEHDDHWRVLGERYKFEVTDLLLKTAAGDDWIADGVPLDECTASLAECDIPGFVVRAVLKEMATPLDDIGARWRLDEAAVCRFRAQEFLQIGSSWDLDSFTETWAASLPEGMHPNPDYLKGLALISKPSELDEKQTVQYFPASSLPVEPRARFAALFSARSVWTDDDITPYIAGIVSKLQTREALLMKHARGYEGKDGTRMYNQK